MWYREESDGILPPMEAIKFGLQCDNHSSMAAQPHKHCGSPVSLASAVDSNIKPYTEEVGEPFAFASVAEKSIGYSVQSANSDKFFPAPNAAAVTSEQRWRNFTASGCNPECLSTESQAGILKEDNDTVSCGLSAGLQVDLPVVRTSGNCGCSYSDYRSEAYCNYPYSSASFGFNSFSQVNQDRPFDQPGDGSYACDELAQCSNSFAVTAASNTVQGCSSTMGDVCSGDAAEVSPVVPSSVMDVDSGFNNQEILGSTSAVSSNNISKYCMPNINVNSSERSNAYQHGFVQDSVNPQSIKFRIRTITDCEFQCPSAPQPFSFLPSFGTAQEQFPHQIVNEKPTLSQQCLSTVGLEQNLSSFNKQQNGITSNKACSVGQGVLKEEDKQCDEIEDSFPNQVSCFVSQGGGQGYGLLTSPGINSSNCDTEHDEHIASRTAPIRSNNCAVISEKLSNPSCEMSNRMFGNWMTGFRKSCAETSSPSSSVLNVDQDAFPTNSLSEPNNTLWQQRFQNRAPKPKFQSVSYIQGEFDGWVGQIKQPQPLCLKDEPSVWKSFSLQTSPFASGSIPVTPNPSAVALIPYQAPSWFDAEAYSKHSARFQDNRQDFLASADVSTPGRLKSAIGKQPLKQKSRCLGSSVSIQKKYRKPVESKSSDDKKFACDYPDCSKRFAKEMELRVHINKYHLGHKKPYYCDTCGKNFKRPDQLKRHQKIHTGEKPHECSVCGRRFARTDHRNTHLSKHTGEKPHACSYRGCDRRFCRGDELRKHEASHHLARAGNGPPSVPGNDHRTRNSSNK